MEVDANGFKFKIEDKIAEKLDLYCDRITKPQPALDACLTNSGGEGEGKSGASVVEAVYAYLKTGRPVHLFFKTSTCQAHLQKTEKQIAILDEPALESLSTDAMTTRSRDFLRLTSTMRSKRHFLIVNVTKFWKFPEFLIVDRALGMVHLHSNNGQDMGRFLYIRKKKLEALWNGYKKNGQRLYGKLKSFGGRFPNVMEDLFKYVPISVEGHLNCTFADYQRLKDEAIASIGQEKSKKLSKAEEELRELKNKIGMLKPADLKTYESIALALSIPRLTISTWKRNAKFNEALASKQQNNDLKSQDSLANQGFEMDLADKLSNNVATEKEKSETSLSEEGNTINYNEIVPKNDDFDEGDDYNDSNNDAKDEEDSV